MDLFRFCETYLLHIKLFVGNQSAISPFLGGQDGDDLGKWCRAKDSNKTKSVVTLLMYT